jgi:hypothetical protein
MRTRTAPVVATLFCLVAAAFGEEKTAQAAASVEQPSGLRGNAEKPFAFTGEDFTRVPTRIGVAYDSGVNHNAGSNTDSYLVTGSVSLMGLQATAEVPVYVSYNPGGGETRDGFGDSFVSASFSLPLNPKFRLALGCDLLLNTSSRDELGPDETVYTPFLGVGIELDETNMFLSRLAYTDSSDGNFERWELLLRGVHRFNDQLFTSVEVTPGWDSLSDEVIIGARALVGARIDQHNIATLDFELPLDSDSRDERGTSLRLSYHFMF